MDEGSGLSADVHLICLVHHVGSLLAVPGDASEELGDVLTDQTGFNIFGVEGDFYLIDHPFDDGVVCGEQADVVGDARRQRREFPVEAVRPLGLFDVVGERG